MVIGRRGRFRSMWSSSRSAATQRLRNSGRNFATGSSSVTFPASTRIIKAEAVIGFDSEAIQNRQSVVIGVPAATSANPTASRSRTRSRSATNTTAPASACESTNGWSRGAIS